MGNMDKLKDLMVDVFLIDPSEFNLGLRREQVQTWDSLGVVSLAVGVQETFGYHFSQEEALGVHGVADVIAILERNGVPFGDV